MKKTAGTLRLDLAQFRELAAFSQFASDLDPATRAQLEKGKRLMELCKQGIGEPLSVCEQVTMIFAGTNDYLKEVPVDKVVEYNTALIESLGTTHKAFADKFAAEVAEDKFSNELKSEMESIVKAHSESFVNAL